MGFAWASLAVARGSLRDPLESFGVSWRSFGVSWGCMGVAWKFLGGPKAPRTQKIKVHHAAPHTISRLSHRILTATASATLSGKAFEKRGGTYVRPPGPVGEWI